MEIILGENQKVIARYKGFEVVTDQPVKAGGDGSMLAPFDLFMLSIGTCTGWYVKSFCQQRNLPETNIRLEQKNHYHPEKQMIDRVDVIIHLPEDFPEKYRHAVVLAASACSVKKHLANPPEIVVRIAEE